jgi:hypothetical protein
MRENEGHTETVRRPNKPNRLTFPSNEHIMIMPNTSSSSTCAMWNIFLLILLLGLDCHCLDAGIGGPNTKSAKVQVEDYIVMQIEMAWGMKEMSRYKSHRGDWPTRSASSFESNDDHDDEDLVAISRAKNEAKEKETSFLKVANGQVPKKQDETIVQVERAQQLRRGRDQSEPIDTGFHTDNNMEEEAPSLDAIDAEMALILECNYAARTVEEYWDTLVAMF